jgi:hypothetical protein
MEEALNPTDLHVQIRRHRHAHHLEGAASQLLQAWLTHFELAPADAKARREIVMALGCLGAGKTPRDPERIQNLPMILLDGPQLEALNAEVTAVQQEIGPAPVAQPAAPAPPESAAQPPAGEAGR